MSFSLRVACIEVMAEAATNALHQHGPLTHPRGEQTPHWQDCARADAHEGAGREAAVATLDALLGVLEEHAPGVGEALDYFDEMGGNTPYGAEIAFDCLNDTQQEAIIRAARLLAVLREDNG